MVKVTFTLDEATVDRLRQTAERTGKAQSQVVREAVHDYSERIGTLSPGERRQMLATLDAIVARRPTRSSAAVDREITGLRAARRDGGRRHRS